MAGGSALASAEPAAAARRKGLGLPKGLASFGGMSLRFCLVTRRSIAGCGPLVLNCAAAAAGVYINVQEGAAAARAAAR